MSEQDIGHGFTLSRYYEDGEGLIGYMVTGPAAPACPYHHDRCGGLVPIRSYHERPVWTVENEEPLTLTPSIVCKCGGQHGFVRAGKYEPC